MNKQAFDELLVAAKHSFSLGDTLKNPAVAGTLLGAGAGGLTYAARQQLAGSDEERQRMSLLKHLGIGGLLGGSAGGLYGLINKDRTPRVPTLPPAPDSGPVMKQIVESATPVVNPSFDDKGLSEKRSDPLRIGPKLMKFIPEGETLDGITKRVNNRVDNSLDEMEMSGWLNAMQRRLGHIMANSNGSVRNSEYRHQQPGTGIAGLTAPEAADLPLEAVPQMISSMRGRSAVPIATDDWSPLINAGKSMAGQNVLRDQPLLVDVAAPRR